MRTALIFAVALAAVACGSETGTTTFETPADGPPTGTIPPIDDPNAPCEQPCPEGAWCSYGRCVMS
jgi:hypothetical protein